MNKKRCSIKDSNLLKTNSLWKRSNLQRDSSSKSQVTLRNTEVIQGSECEWDGTRAVLGGGDNQYGRQAGAVLRVNKRL